MEKFNVCFSDPLNIEFDVFSLWLQGFSGEEAAKHRTATESGCGIPFYLLISDTRDQFQVFHLLEKYLQSPPLFNIQMLCTIEPQVQQKLIESYYEFDKDVMREILGKKISAKLRKDMDDVSEKTGIPLKRCRRQFDNVKNILKTYEDGEGATSEIIQKQFHLSDKLTKVYASMVFIFTNRFETNKKRLSYLTFDDFIYCADQMLEYWTVSTTETCSVSDQQLEPDDLDRNFFQELRDVRNFATDRDVNDHHKNLVCSYLEQRNLHALEKSVEAIFRTLTRAIFQTSSSLANSKDLRDFFSNTVEKIIEPIKQMEWTKDDLNTFMKAIINTWDDIKPPHRGNALRLSGIYARFMKPFSKCLLQMYHP